MRKFQAAIKTFKTFFQRREDMRCKPRPLTVYEGTETTRELATHSQPESTFWKLTIENPRTRCEICSKLTIKTPKALSMALF